ncbi:septum formation initiator family protein [Candidatus Parcubacteria bacterium]|nr:septum formation initiator family protein [Candidatus Parcubacteria bacterium]
MVGDGQGKHPAVTKAWLLVAVCAAVGSAVGVAAWREFRRSYVVERHAEQVRSDRTKLEADREALRTLLAAFKNPEALEREAKVRLNLRREGEKVVVLVPGTGDTERARPSAGEPLPAPPTSPSSPRSGFAANARSWWDYLFGARPPR